MVAAHKTLFVFDIETVPDVAAARRLLNLAESCPDTEVLEKLTEYHLKVTDGRNAFFRQPFHKIVAISFLQAEIQHKDGKEIYALQDVRSGGNNDSSEAELVQGLFNYLGKISPRLVSFNGRTFDLPVLKYRAMLHDVQAAWLHRTGDKWNSYNSRYSLDWHCDLLDAFSDFGTSSRIKMHELCALFGLPGKLDVDGSQVSALYNQGKIQEIRDYCELDVLNTYLLYLKYMLHTAHLTTEQYELCCQDLFNYLEKHSISKPHFAKFIDEWIIN
jgi:predicted PolB exonuclease-like 3'-5' exonuclease